MKVTIEYAVGSWVSKQTIESNTLPVERAEELAHKIMELLSKPDATPPVELPVAVSAPVAAMKEPEGAEPPVIRRGSHGMLLYLVCPQCHEGFFKFSSEDIIKAQCRCGKTISTENLRLAEFYCPTCDKKFWYRTNSTEPVVINTCGKCGNPLRARWNNIVGKYFPDNE